MKKLVVLGLLACVGMSVYGMTEKEAVESLKKSKFSFAEKGEQLKHLRKVREQCPQLFLSASPVNSLWKMQIINDLVFGGDWYFYDVAVLEEFLSYDPRLLSCDWEGMKKNMEQGFQKKEVSEEQFTLVQAYLERIQLLGDDDIHENEIGEKKIDPVRKTKQTNLDNTTSASPLFGRMFSLVVVLALDGIVYRYSNNPKKNSILV